MRKLFLVAASILIALTGCDSGDPDDAPDPSDVDGIYLFTEFNFQPSGAGFQPIQVLDTLDAEDTELRLLAEGDFILFYQFEAGDLHEASGSFGVSTGSVTLDADDEDEADMERILLGDRVTLRRDPDQPDVLTASISQTINPSAFSDRYEGVESMAGTLQLRLERD